MTEGERATRLRVVLGITGLNITFGKHLLLPLIRTTRR